MLIRNETGGTRPKKRSRAATGSHTSKNGSKHARYGSNPKISSKKRSWPGEEPFSPKIDFFTFRGVSNGYGVDDRADNISAKIDNLFRSLGKSNYFKAGQGAKKKVGASGVREYGNAGVSGKRRGNKRFSQSRLFGERGEVTSGRKRSKSKSEFFDFFVF